MFAVDAQGIAIDYRPGDFRPLLSDGFTLDYFLGLISATELKSLSVKAFLATKNRIPGLDNSILQEILWEAQINPKHKMAALREEDYVKIYHAIQTVLPEVIAAGGKDTEKDLFGHIGRYQTHASKNTLGKPCPRCGQPIVKEAYLGGAIYSQK